MFGKNKNKKAHPVHLYRKNTLSKKKKRSSRNKKGESVRSKQKTHNFVEMLYWLSVIVFLAYGFYLFFLSPYVAIQSIQLEGNEKVSEEAILERSQEFIGEKKFSFLPKTYFFFSSRTLQKKLQRDFSDIRDITLTKTFPDTLYIHIEEYVPELAWCGGEQCFLLDTYGEAYQEASKEAISEELLVIQDASFQDISLGKHVLSSDRIAFFLRLQEMFYARSSIDLEREFALKSALIQEGEIQTKEGWKILLSTSIPVEKSLIMFETFVAKSLDDESRKKLEYVDLRIENKIFYKVEQEETEEICEEDEACQERTEETNQGE